MKPLSSLRLFLAMWLLAAFVLAASAGGPFCWEGPEAAKPAASTTQERDRLLAMGRELFFQKCGSCHDADGSKPMSDGPPLNQRKVTEERVSRVVDSRFKTANEEQRRAVKLHINTFMKR